MKLDYSKRPQNLSGRIMKHRKTGLPRFQGNQILCTYCSLYKEQKDFTFSNLNHKHYVCKECSKKYRSNRKGNINRLIDNIFAHQQFSKSKLDVLYTWEEFSSWVLQQKKFLTLYKIWIESEFDRNVTPSVIRIDSKKPFTLDNLKITTSRLAQLNSSHSRNRCVAQLDENKNEITRYPNAKIAASLLNYKYYSNIHEACKGKKKRVAGFHWKYV
jgi:hypothetical protein